MISRVFIDRPVFAWVVAIVIMMAGLAAILRLPIEQYPDIAPTTVNIRANYPGASAEVIEGSVTQVIEQQLTGIDGLLYFQSTSSSAGTVTINVTFDKGTDADIAQVQVQNKVQQALPRLPQQVQQQGLTVTKSAPDLLLIAAVYDETDRATNIDVADYLIANLQDRIARLPGVGDINVFGAQYAMRIWLDPVRLSGFELVPDDVIAAIRAQNIQVAAGQLGAPPYAAGQALNAIVTAQGRLNTPEQFRAIILKTAPDGSLVRLADVARVELGAESYTSVTRVNRHPGAGIGVQLAPGADALEVSEVVKQTIEQASRGFPPGYRYAFPVDSTAFIRLSIEEVVKTLAEAILLVVIVMFVFLQSWRATLIPALAVPVVLLGTFGVLALFGYSINVLTLFALVLAIGLLVDDAIVVVENVERVMEEEPGISPRDATMKSMAEIQTALIAIGLVLSAVFLPIAFFGGSVGVIYRQFAITIVAAMTLSVVVALVLTPALTATLLKPKARGGQPRPRTVPARWAARFQAWFNDRFGRMTAAYERGTRTVIARRPLALGVYVLFVAGLAILFVRLPTGFLPTEDQGRVLVQYTLPPGATLDRTLAVARQVEDFFLGDEAANTTAMFANAGSGSGGQGQNVGQAFVSLTDWSARGDAQAAADAIVQRATRALGASRDARVFALLPPAVRGLGTSSGFTMQLLNSGGLPRADFIARREALLAAARADPELAGVRFNGLEDAPTLEVTLDEEKAGALGLTYEQINSTLSAAWGGAYVNDFIDRGRVKRVYVQGDAPYRSSPEDLRQWQVRSAGGGLASFNSFANTGWRQAPLALTRFSGVPSFEIQGQAAPGRSSGQAMERIAALAARQPGVSIAWSGLSYQERQSSGQAPILYALSLLVVFLCLAALYESWSVPLAVLLVVPLGLLGAVLAVTLRGLENDVFFQVGLLTTIGLSAKNAILIVEFAEAAERAGKSAYDAAVDAARQRLRPILMTSLAFVFGVVPLAIATGAGAQSRIAIGTGVIGGMITATLLAIFFVPLFYVLVRKVFGGQAIPDHRGRLMADARPEPAE